MIKLEDLSFYFGTMGSSKTARLLMKYYNLKVENRSNVLLLTPSIDDRAGVGVIKSRTGIEANAEIVSANTNILDLVSSSKNVLKRVMVDEVQFLTNKQIQELKAITTGKNPIPVDAYGLKLNFKGNLFGEKERTIEELIKLATYTEEIRSSCICGNKATHVARFNIDDWIIQKEGPEIVIGGNESYFPLCYYCWSQDKLSNLARIAILENVFEEEVKKGINVDLKKLDDLKNKMDTVNDAINKENILRLKTEIKDSKRKLKTLESSMKNKNLSKNKD